MGSRRLWLLVAAVITGALLTTLLVTSRSPPEPDSDFVFERPTTKLASTNGFLTLTDVLGLPRHEPQDLDAFTETPHPQQIAEGGKRGHYRAVTAIAAWPSGKLISSSYDESLLIWDHGRRIVEQALLELGDPFVCVAVSPDGAHCALGSVGGYIQVRDREHTRTLEGHGSWVTGVSWSPNGARIASSSWDRTVRVWDVATGRQVHVFDDPDFNMFCVAWSPNGERVDAGGMGFFSWDSDTGEAYEVLFPRKGIITAVTYSPNGALLVAASGSSAFIMQPDTGEVVHELRGHVGMVGPVTVAPDSRWVITGGWDRVLRVWDAQKGAEVDQLELHREAAARMVRMRKKSLSPRAFAWRGDRLWVGCGDGTLAEFQFRPPG